MSSRPQYIAKSSITKAISQRCIVDIMDTWSLVTDVEVDQTFNITTPIVTAPSSLSCLRAFVRRVLNNQ